MKRSFFSILIATAIAAVAFAAPTASATEPVEVTDEHTTNHCPAVTIAEHAPDGGCEVSAESVPGNHLELEAHVHGVGELVVLECENHFDAVIQETGHGFVYNQVLTDEEVDPGAPCETALEPCDEEVSEQNHPNIPWPFHMHEFANALFLGITFCVRDAGVAGEGVETGQRPCTIAIPVVDTNDHDYVAATLAPGSDEALTSASRCSEAGYVSFQGIWAIDSMTHDEIEIDHEEE